MSVNNLPVEWLLTELNQVLTVKNGYAFKSKDYILEKATDDLVSVIRISDIQDNSVSTQKSVFVEKEKASENFKIDKGDLLIAMSGATTGKTGIFREEIQAFLNQRVGNLKVHSPEYFLPKFRNFLIQNLSNQILENAYGGAQPNISSKDIESLVFGLPPLAEQQEIVRQLDVMLAQVEQIKARLDAIPAILKKFRQSVLAQVVDGSLINGNKHSYLPLEKLGKMFGGKTPSKSNPAYWQDGDVFWVSPKDMKRDLIDSSEDKITQLAVKDGMKLIPNESVLMVTRSGILQHTFPVAINVKEVTINQDIKAFVPNKSLVLTKYLALVLKGSESKILETCSKAGTTVGSIETNLLEKFSLLIPKINEQKLIVSSVENSFSMIKNVEETVKLAQKRVNLLTQSILAKAFSGELTAEWREQHQDLITGVNSAESLLATIQAEREVNKPVKKSRAKKEV